ncbi:phosphoserine phosphatase [Colwellia sp. MT41]|uniref:Phosphoserine phosphatase n=1 Tax=Colwellia marinimaniae TaxID=1513592 RepID=A0ABQ0MR92_9GAMM|nr:MULTISPECIES: phosphoserine phosphatase SerB [Colwellia]ALO34050.1 phosphoserine phosphatase [Colwellia sp. MT41]GAW94854.1 phosphoserine phosphatase [Colwellia marinimaniae]
MSFIANVLPLSLAQYLAHKLADKQLPIAFDLSEQALNLDKHPLGTSSAQDKIELVVFQQLTLAQLLAIQSQVKLKIIALTTINHRNNQTSCRFQVRCADFIKARKALADFTLANKIEAALLSQVPSLSEPGLLVMDMDSTTIAIECIDEIAKLAGVGEEVAAVTERAMLGELDFAQSLHQRVATLAGAPISILSDVAKDLPLMAGLKPLITELKKHNWRIAIASGGFTYFADHLKETLNLDAAFANTLEIIDGKLTGKVLGDVVDAQVKADSLAILSKEYNIPKSQTVAMGDGANDLVMMAAASFGVAFHAKPIVLAQADSSINVQGLDCLLHWLA